MRMFLDRQTLLPKRVESLDAQGAVALHSDLGRYDSVKQQGKNPAAFPKLARLIDIAQADPKPENAGQVKIAINQYTDGFDQPFDRVFDLKRLTQSFRPDRIEGEEP